MLEVSAKPAKVRDTILTKVQLEKHNINVLLDLDLWEIKFPKIQPIVMIKLMRKCSKTICVVFCRVGPDRKFFYQWERKLRKLIEYKFNA